MSTKSNRHYAAMAALIGFIAMFAPVLRQDITGDSGKADEIVYVFRSAQISKSFRCTMTGEKCSYVASIALYGASHEERGSIPASSFLRAVNALDDLHFLSTSPIDSHWQVRVSTGTSVRYVDLATIGLKEALRVEAVMAKLQESKSLVAQ